MFKQGLKYISELVIAELPTLEQYLIPNPEVCLVC